MGFPYGRRAAYTHAIGLSNLMPLEVAHGNHRDG
jgi:hypothetical protein